MGEWRERKGLVFLGTRVADSDVAIGLSVSVPAVDDVATFEAATAAYDADGSAGVPGDEAIR